jgi:hypothetical protein
MAGVDGRHAGSVADRSRRLYPLRGSAVRPRRRSAGRALAVSQRRLCDRTGDGAFLLHALILLSDLRGLPAERAPQVATGGGPRHAAVRGGLFRQFARVIPCHAAPGRARADAGLRARGARLRRRDARRRKCACG